MTGQTFAALLDKAIERSGRLHEVKQIELGADQAARANALAAKAE